MGKRSQPGFQTSGSRQGLEIGESGNQPEGLQEGEPFLRQGRTDTAKRGVNCRSNMLDTADGGQRDKGDQQGVFDQILPVFPVEEDLVAHVETEKELVHLILRRLEC